MFVQGLSWGEVSDIGQSSVQNLAYPEVMVRSLPSLYNEVPRVAEFWKGLGFFSSMDP